MVGNGSQKTYLCSFYLAIVILTSDPYNRVSIAITLPYSSSEKYYILTYKILCQCRIVHCGHTGTGETTFLQQCKDISPSTEVNCYYLVSPFTRESSRCVCAMKLNLARAWPSLGRLGIVRIPSYGIICGNKMLTCWRYEQQYSNLRTLICNHT
jgi:hypothetical protein